MTERLEDSRAPLQVPVPFSSAAAVPEPWRVESMMAGGRDISAGTIKLVDRNLSDVVITLTNTKR